MKNTLICLFVFTSLTALSGQKDVAGSKDHPLISRFNGSWIRFYEFNKFNQYKLRTSPIKRGAEATAKSTVLEGAVYRILYQCPKTVSAFELYKSYEKALEQQGFEKLYSCETDACGNGFGNNYPSDDAPHIRTYTQDQRYWAGKRTQDDGEVLYVSVFTVFTQDGPVARLDIIETKTMEEGQVTVTAAKIKSEFDQLGKAVINQVYFESAKAVLQPQSAPALAEVAQFLKNNAGLKIYVVGHTDHDGSLESNMTLSQQRAEAVVAELTTKHGIAADRLKAKGVGFLCPVASNDNEKGKAKNRRVELVRQ